MTDVGDVEVHGDVATVLARSRGRWRDETCALARSIYEDPELSGGEHRAARRCWEVLERAGFDVQPVKGVPTAFVASFSAPHPGPTVGLLAEYDALPGLGHACGHHLIAASAVGAGLMLSDVIGSLAGTVRIYGCPAEETLEGKAAMLEAGVFDGLDAALTFHAHDSTTVMRSSNGLQFLTFRFRGRASHAGNEPWAGASALDGVLLTCQNVNALRQFVRDGVRMHGIVTHGGDAYNIVPELAECRFAVRSVDAVELERVVERVVDCARAAAIASGTQLDVERGSTIPPVLMDDALADRVRRSLESLDHAVSEWNALATTDFANVSRVVPAVLFSVETWPRGTAFHSPEATTEGGTDRALDAMLDAAFVMADVTAELLGTR